MRYLLFTTTTCPKCPAMKNFVAENLQNLEGETLDNTSPDFGERIAEAKVQTAPTIIFYEGDSEVFRASEVGELVEWLEKKQE